MATKDNRETDHSHESTWGATEPAKQAWADKNADRVRKTVERDNEQKAAE